MWNQNENGGQDGHSPMLELNSASNWSTVAQQSTSSPTVSNVALPRRLFDSKFKNKRDSIFVTKQHLRQHKLAQNEGASDEDQQDSDTNTDNLPVNDSPIRVNPVFSEEVSDVESESKSPRVRSNSVRFREPQTTGQLSSNAKFARRHSVMPPKGVRFGQDDRNDDNKAQAEEEE